MTKTRTMLFTAALAAFLAVPAAAQTGTIGIYSYPNPGVPWNGVYVGPYQLAIGGMGGYTIDAVCVDYLHEITVPETWTVYFTNLGNIGAGTPGLTLTRGGTGSLQLYQEAAWLTTQFQPGNMGQWGNIHATIWNLFQPAAPDPTNNDWLTLAQANYKNVPLSEINVITPVTTDPLAVNTATSSAQEFVQVTPEPQVYLLLGTGLLLLGLLYMKRQRAALSA